MQNASSLDCLKSAGITNCTVAGDTRFDRVLELSLEKKDFPLIQSFCNASNVVVAGSTWREDEKLLSQIQESNLKFIVAPHEIDEESLCEVEKVFSHFRVLRFSKANQLTIETCNVLLIDSIGILSYLYRYGTICYIGGGFGKGIHNILEAAVHAKPILFGPNFQKFEEAKTLIELGGASSIENLPDLQNRITELLHDKKKYREQCLISESYVHGNGGAVSTIYAALK